jgi:hypothetical protein
MAVHKHCYTSLNLTQQGGRRRRETVSLTDNQRLRSIKRFNSTAFRYRFRLASRADN